NGASAASNTGMTLTPSSLGATDKNWLGRSQFGDPLLNGAIDEVQIYDHALSATEITALTTSADGGLGGGNVAWYRFDETDGNAAADSSANKHDAAVVSESAGAPGP